jgi:CRP-like cAMP-binding protein
MPSTEKLRKYLEQFCPIPQADWELFSGKLQRRVFRRKQQVIKPGEVENYVSFIDQGIVRYYVEEGDKDITFEIAFENSLASVYDSFLTRQPVTFSAEALVATEFWSITYADVQDFYATSKVGNELGRLATEQLYIRKNKRQMALLKDTAEQRYLHMLKEYTHFIQLVPLKYLASYIGITPQALSRIRRRLTGEPEVGRAPKSGGRQRSDGNGRPH